MSNDFFTIILNYAPLTERAEWMKKQLVRAQFTNYKFHQKEYDYNNYKFSPNLIKQQSSATSTDYPIKKLNRAEFDLICKHQYALIEAYDMPYSNILILEDDALLLNGYQYNDIEQKINNVPEDYDVIVVGGPFDHSICKYSKYYPECFLANHPATNTSSSILYKKNIIPIVSDMLQSIQLPLDWALNYIYKTNNFKVYHLYPYIFKQNKDFKSSIQ